MKRERNTDRYEVYYCAKWDEIHLVKRYWWNKHLAATLIEGFLIDGQLYEWITIAWPRPQDGYPFIKVAKF